MFSIDGDLNGWCEEGQQVNAALAECRYGRVLCQANARERNGKCVKGNLPGLTNSTDRLSITCTCIQFRICCMYVIFVALNNRIEKKLYGLFTSIFKYLPLLKTS